MRMLLPEWTFWSMAGSSSAHSTSLVVERVKAFFGQDNWNNGKHHLKHRPFRRSESKLTWGNLKSCPNVQLWVQSWNPNWLMGVWVYMCQVANGPGKVQRSNGAVPQDDAKTMRGFFCRVLVMKVGLEMSARKFSFYSYLSLGKITLHAHFSIKQEDTWPLLMETRQEDPGY